MTEDRFKTLSHDYAKLIDEVFSTLGLSYDSLQKSIFDAVSIHYKNRKDISILDIGCGDGESLALFVDAGYTNLTGIDLNAHMLNISNKRFGSKVKLLHVDATHMNIFKKNQFDAIITGGCIHNIPLTERKLFWRELSRLNPKLIVIEEKIADSDPIKHKKYYQNEINAIINIYKNKYKLDSLAQDWVDHYKVDEREKLTLDEINENLSKFYKVKVFLEMSMSKTVVAVRRD